MGNVISAVIGGLVIGIFARWFYPGTVPMGFLMTILLGVGGSLLAGLVTASRTGGINDGINRAGCLASIIGAMVLIFLGRHFGWH